MTHILDKNRAADLITPVVDDEATPAEKHAFLLYISKKENHLIKVMYLQEKRLKEFISKKYKKTKAPKSLYTFLEKFAYKTE